MAQPRFNVFNQIHKTLRMLMFETLQQMQQTDLSDPVRSQPVIAQTALLLDIFDDHAEHEDHFILHVAEQYAPDVIEDLGSEHVEDRRLSDALREKLDAYTKEEDKYIAGFDLYYALNDFAAFNLRHMNKEETVLNQVLWKYYTDAEILDMQTNIQRSIPPEKAGVYLPWMIRGINDAEMIQWLKALRSEAPQFVVDGVTGACAQFLPADRWTVIQQSIQ